MMGKRNLLAINRWLRQFFARRSVKVVSKTILVIVTAILLIPTILLILYILFTLIRSEQSRRNWENYLSTPMPAEMADDFCERDLVPSESANCEDSQTVLQRRHVRDIFEANLEPGATYADVTDLFGEYEYTCESWDDVSYYQCRYWRREYRVKVRFDRTTDEIVEVLWYQAGGS